MRQHDWRLDVLMMDAVPEQGAAPLYVAPEPVAMSIEPGIEPAAPSRTKRYLIAALVGAAVAEVVHLIAGAF